MYHEVHRQHLEGLKPAQIARELVMDRRTVKKYLAMSEEECEQFIDSQTQTRDINKFFHQIFLSFRLV